MLREVMPEFAWVIGRNYIEWDCSPVPPGPATVRH